MRRELRLVPAIAAAALVAGVSSSVSAAPSASAQAIAVGALTLTSTSAVGVAMLGADAEVRPRGDTGEDQDVARAGWAILGGGFVLAPLVAHAVAGEGLRGLLFAVAPAACLVGTTVVLSDTSVDRAKSRDQRAVFAFTSAGLLGALVGVVDAAGADGRALRVAPSVAPGFAGILIGGNL